MTGLLERVPGKMVWSTVEVSGWPVLPLSTDGNVEECKKQVKEGLDDSVDAHCFSFVHLFEILSCKKSCICSIILQKRGGYPRIKSKDMQLGMERSKR